MNSIILLFTAIVAIARETFNSVSDTVRTLGIRGVLAIARIASAADSADAIHTSDIIARYGIHNGVRAWDELTYENFLIERIPSVLAGILGDRFDAEDLAKAAYELLSEESFAESLSIPEEPMLLS